MDGAGEELAIDEVYIVELAQHHNVQSEQGGVDVVEVLVLG